MSMSEQDVRFLENIGDHNILTRDEEVQYARVIKNEEDDSERSLAIEKMVKHNQKLVIQKAHSYNRLVPSIDVMDFWGAGNHGLMEAINLYDPDKFGTRFSTFATARIINPMQKMITRSGHVTVPYYLRQLQNQYYRLIQSGETDDAKIMKALDVDEAMLDKIRGCEVKAVFLDAIDYDGHSLSDVIADETLIAPDDKADGNQLFETLYEFVSKLSEKEQYVIMHRVFTDDKWTLEKVSKQLNITKERVRQIQKEAINKLRSMLEQKGMDHYVEPISSC